MLKIAHIINPVKVKDTSDLFVAQPITFETMQIARQIAKQHGIEVTLCSAQFSEDREFIPDTFLKTPDLKRSVLDFGQFQIERKLPLIKDILDRLYEATDADYLIYTNVDIALMPHFYLAIDRLIRQGYDAFVINRRTILASYQKLEDIPLMYSQLGTEHPGHDCFIFKKDGYLNYRLNCLCIGASLIGRGLVINLICNAQKFEVFKNLHLTFHIGDDRTWVNKKLEDYTIHNLKELNEIVKTYEQTGSIEQHPLISSFMANSKDHNYWLGKPHKLKKIRQNIVSLLSKNIKYLQTKK
jgi:hypothetical protein